MPSTIEEVQRQWKDRGLVVLAVNIEESKSTVAAWVKEKKVTVPVLLDADGAITRRYRVTGTPTVFVVGRDGTMVGVASGTKAWTSDKGKALLGRLTSP